MPSKGIRLDPLLSRNYEMRFFSVNTSLQKMKVFKNLINLSVFEKKGGGNILPKKSSASSLRENKV